MNPTPATHDSIPVGAEFGSEESKVAAFFQQLEYEQLSLLDEAGKRVAELSVALLGILFAVLAFGGTFPPPLLISLPMARPLVLGSVLLLFFALLVSILAIRPRSYRRYRYNLTQMQQELERMVAFKSFWVGAASVLFVLGCLGLVSLVSMIIW